MFQENFFIFFFIFLQLYLAAPRPTLSHYREDCLTHPMLILALFKFHPEGHWNPRNDVGFRSPAERIRVDPWKMRFRR